MGKRRRLDDPVEPDPCSHGCGYPSNDAHDCPAAQADAEHHRPKPYVPPADPDPTTTEFARQARVDFITATDSLQLSAAAFAQTGDEDMRVDVEHFMERQADAWRRMQQARDSR